MTLHLAQPFRFLFPPAGMEHPPVPGLDIPSFPQGLTPSPKTDVQ